MLRSRCLFKYLNTRAIQLEAAEGLDVDSFINKFHRSVNYRELPETL